MNEIFLDELYLILYSRLLNHVMWDYRNERWWNLLSSSSFLALNCAYQTAAITDYVALSLEILGMRITSSSEQKSRAYANLKKLLAVSFFLNISNGGFHLKVENFNMN